MSDLVETQIVGFLTHRLIYVYSFCLSVVLVKSDLVENFEPDGYRLPDGKRFMCGV